MKLLASKHLLELEDGNKITLMTARNNSIVCFPSQLGCNYREVCKICSAKQFVRNLTWDEMAGAIEAVIRYETKLISCMGEGEPLDNSFVATLLDSYSRKYKTAISTRVPSIEKLKLFIMRSPYTKLQFSSHTMEPKRLDEALYQATKCNVEINLVAMPDVDIESIASLATKHRRVVKLSRWNDSRYDEEDRAMLYEYMRSKGVSVELYNHDGREINASCGQLQSF